MRITKIKLINYKPYYGTQIIEIPRKGKIVILKGENGAGKTTLINGLTWCLYHENIHYEELFNDEAASELQAGERIFTSIEIHFEHKGRNHLLKREVSGIKIAHNKLDNYQEIYKLEIINEGEIITYKDDLEIENYINSILNESVKSYFFFDAARIDTFTKDDHNKDVEKAIKNLLKIETIVRARDHIKNIAREIRNLIIEENHDELLEQKKNKVDELEKKLREYNDDIDNLTKEISNIEKDIENSLNEIEHYQKNSQYVDIRNEYQNKLNQTQNSFNELNKEISEKLNKSYVIFADKLTKDAMDIVNNKILLQKTHLSPSTMRKIIKETLDNDMCYICGEVLQPDKREDLSSRLLVILDDKDYDSNLTQSLQNFKILRKESEETIRIIREKKKLSNEYYKDIEAYSDKVNEYEQKIDNDLPDAKQFKEVIEKLTQDKEEKYRKKVNYENNTSLIEEKIKTIEEEIMQINKKYDRYKEEQKKLEICNQMRDELERIFEKYEKTEISKINYESKKIFDLIIRKQGVFTKVFIDNDYKLNVQREYSNKNVLKQLSYGERQILSFSLILALAKVSGDQGPFVMDTPMGNLDPIHRRKLLLNVPALVNQLLLLVTSSEFTADLYDICHNDLSTQYNLFIESKGTTIIQKEV